MNLRTLIFYIVLCCLVGVDSFLLSKPNLLGKVGLIIYKYHYLRSFPRTLLTVTILISVALLMCWTIKFLVLNKKLSLRSGLILLGVGTLGVTAILVKTMYDFTSWSYSHTGWKFKYGVFLLLITLIFVFVFYSVDIKLKYDFQRNSQLPNDANKKIS
jgi:hypothetical protein